MIRTLAEAFRIQRERKGISMKMWMIIALILSLFVAGSIVGLATDFMNALMSGGGILSILSDLTGGMAG